MARGTLATARLGLVGFTDDYLKVVRKRTKGLVVRYKMAGQLALGLVVGLLVYHGTLISDPSEVEVPFLKDYVLQLGGAYVLFVMIVIAASSNAVNLSDGLDGLAIGLAPLRARFRGDELRHRQREVQRLPEHPVLSPGPGELTVFCSAMIGAALGFLWFNAHPAEVFMGDTGSLAVGGALGTLAILIKKEIWLVIVGCVFVAIAAR